MSLQLHRIEAYVGGRCVLHGIDLEVPDGAVVGLIGPNGSGKSTALKTMYRQVRPSSGAVLLDGEDLLGMTPRAAARRLAVLSQENHAEFDATTVGEMVMLGRSPHQRAFAGDSREDRAAVQHALEQVGCSHLTRRSIHELSGGERQRVYLARALAQGADHLILDEPTNHLDIRYQSQVLELVTGLGITVLTALHDLSLASLYCDTVYLLDGGRVVAHGAPADVITADMVRRTYGAEVLVVEHPDSGVPQVLPRRR